MKCQARGCTELAVSRVWDAYYCFQHEREMVDRYGYGHAQPQPLSVWRLSPRAAIEYLRRDA